MNKKIFRKVIKVIAIIAAYFISMIGAAFAGSVMTLAAEKEAKKEEVKTEVKEVKTERSNERVIIGFARTE